jgi:rare lipoprotein A
MSSNGKASYVDLQASRAATDRIHFEPPLALTGAFRQASVAKLSRLFAMAVAAASLAACAQSSVVTRKSEFSAASRPASPQHERPVAFLTNRPVVPNRPPFVPSRAATETRGTSQGLASFYTEGTRTASGEKFDTHELTAAHPTLPFGTHLRVTNIATGRSVTVRVNDRGPYVPGRIVDVSYSAAASLGMVGRGVAKVKLDVVQ